MIEINRQASGSPDNFFDLTKEELSELFNNWQEPGFRADQVWNGVYVQLKHNWGEFTNIPKSLIAKLEENYSLSRIKPVVELISKDRRTTKTALSLQDGQIIETVLMRYEKRNTLCISSQVGCAMGCVFCATGQMGFFKNLSRGEIVEQVIYYSRKLTNEANRVTNIVIMGMGEPFRNYSPTIEAIDILGNQSGMNLGERRFTISTVGIIPGINRFTQERRQINLAISLHAANDLLRSELLPINRRYPIADLMQACLEYVKTTHRRISFEWALINGVNDTQGSANELGRLLQPFRIQGSALCHVNLIPLNPTGKYTGESTTRASAEAFNTTLAQWGIPSTIRVRRGIDIQAGCGQLASLQSNNITQEV
jgi:23S rRNA (adenine2503-C2)-methyltransferase